MLTAKQIRSKENLNETEPNNKKFKKKAKAYKNQSFITCGRINMLD